MKKIFSNSSKAALITVISATVLIVAFIACFFLLSGNSSSAPTVALPDSSYEHASSDNSSNDSSEQASSQLEVTPLSVTYPKENNITVTESTISVMGSCDTKTPLYINGKEVKMSSSGEFSEDIELTQGKNTIKITQGEITVTKTVVYRYVIIKDYSPSSAKSFTSGSNLVVSSTARKGSTITAELNGKKVTLTQNNEDEGEFVSFYGMFSLPKDNLKELKIGKVKFTGKYGKISESFYSGEITIKKTSLVSPSDPNATPSGDGYINVGSGYIAEIIQFQAETFDGKFTASNSDWSRPTNNYLPKGTVDYCSTGLVYDGGISYVTLRCGRRVYNERTDSLTGEKSNVVKRYVGKLPDHNELKVSEFKTEEKHTYLVLDTLFKAPFKVSLSPQSYVQPSYQDYRVEDITFSYVDITFCYATVFDGEIEIPKNHPIFKRAELIKKQSEYTLRLHLKEKGAFYGWDAYYNDKGQLCFSFLNPAYTKAANNEYGRDLSSVTILIDAGHGGKDAGALGINPKKLNEAKANLTLAFLIKAELEKMGAKVVMTRTNDTSLSADDRHKIIKNLAPDLCISVHHDANNSSKLNGFGSFYFNAFSKKAAELVYNRTISTGLYNQTSNNRNRLDWHYFFLARNTVCPVVLTENGYMTNSGDFAAISNEAKMKKKAKAIVMGVVDYFVKICPEAEFEPPKPEPPQSSFETATSSEQTETSSIEQTSSEQTETSSIEQTSSEQIETSSIEQTSSNEE